MNDADLHARAVRKLEQDRQVALGWVKMYQHEATEDQAQAAYWSTHAKEAAIRAAVCEYALRKLGGE